MSMLSNELLYDVSQRASNLKKDLDVKLYFKKHTFLEILSDTDCVIKLFVKLQCNDNDTLQVVSL